MRIVFDHPGRQVTGNISRWLGRLFGSLLVFLGLLGTVVAVPTGLVTVGDIVNSLQTKPEDLRSPNFPLRRIEAGFALAIVTAVVGLRYGRRLYRGRRRIVLFLRRFGYDGSMQVVTYAVANTIGTSWRLVTLDDDEIAPVGVDTASRLVFGTGERLAALAPKVYQGILIWFQWSVWGMFAVAGLQAAMVAPDWQRLLDEGIADRYSAIFAAVMDRRIPSEYFAFSLPGAFAMFATGVGLGLVALLIAMAVLLAMIPLSGVLIFASAAAEALRKAEQEKKAAVTQPSELAPLVHQLSVRGRETFAPRLVVVRVAGALWQQTVSSLASVAAATIVDISEPTVNLAWELSELDRLDQENRCIFIGDRDRLTHLRDSNSSNTRYVASLVGDREVLAYTPDRAGMRRFARALYGMLLDLPR